MAGIRFFLEMARKRFAGRLATPRGKVLLQHSYSGTLFLVLADRMWRLALHARANFPQVFRICRKDEKECCIVIKE
jgi:hypothetical protein